MNKNSGILTGLCRFSFVEPRRLSKGAYSFGVRSGMYMQLPMHTEPRRPIAHPQGPAY